MNRVLAFLILAAAVAALSVPLVLWFRLVDRTANAAGWTDVQKWVYFVGWPVGACYVAQARRERRAAERSSDHGGPPARETA